MAVTDSVGRHLEADGRLLAGGPEPARVWPAWQVPAAALRSWLALAQVLREMPLPPACEADPGRWWSSPRSATGAERQAEAVAACGWCPAMEACRAYACASDEREGVWGGTTPAERRELAGRRR